MAKPDLQAAYVDPKTGQIKRLKGKLGLGVSNMDSLTAAADDTAAASAGVLIGELYRTGSTIKVRVA